MKPIRSQKIRDSARGEKCTLQIPGVCNSNKDTTVLAHLPDESKGMGRKADDISAWYACSSCHDAIDGRNPHAWVTILEDRDWYMRRAMVRTWRAMIESGLITIAGYKHGQ